MNEENITLTETPTEVESSEEVTPETMEESVSQSTTSEEEQNLEESEQVEESTGVENVEPVGETDWKLPVRFNHQLRELSMEEAQTYAQKGMQSESVMNDLRYLAARSNMSSVAELVKNLKESSEQTRREELSRQLGGDEELINTILSAESKKWLDAAGVILDNENKALAEETQSATEKFADEFIALQKEFPEIQEFKNVPADVVASAMKNNISLFDAFLRFKHEENKKITKAEQTETAAKAAGTGSGKSVDSDVSSPAVEAMRRGVWS